MHATSRREPKATQLSQCRGANSAKRSNLTPLYYSQRAVPKWRRSPRMWHAVRITPSVTALHEAYESAHRITARYFALQSECSDSYTISTLRCKAVVNQPAPGVLQLDNANQQRFCPTKAQQRQWDDERVDDRDAHVADNQERCGKPIAPITRLFEQFVTPLINAVRPTNTAASAVGMRLQASSRCSMDSLPTTPVGRACSCAVGLAFSWA
jgi:hypothetical protein